MGDVDRFVRQPHQALDVVLRRIRRIMEDDHVPTLQRLQLVAEFVDQNAVAVVGGAIAACQRFMGTAHRANGGFTTAGLPFCLSLALTW